MIRKFTPADTDKIMNLWLETTTKAHDFIDPEYWTENFDYVRNECLLKSEAYIYEDRRRIKGFISILKGSYIGALFVSPDCQRQKIGTKLLNYAKKLHPSLSLNVYVNNKAALDFYQKNDFKIIVDKIDLDTGEEELFMAWGLGCKSGFQKRRQGDS